MRFLTTFHLWPFLDTLVSYVVAFVLGTLIGAERQYRQRTAGLRTNALVAIGAAAFTDLGQRLGGDVESIRVIAYVVSGIGFLGAGVIMKEGMNVRGLNTAATLWCSAAVGAIAGSDMLAEAAIRVLSENRLMKKVKVAGQDADLAACQRIAEGTQFATIYKPIDQLALKAAGFAVMLAKGEPIPTDTTLDDGAYKVPYVRLEPILVTKELLKATVIKGGFHTEAEVYRNVAP